MPVPFADLAARVDQAVIAHLADAVATWDMETHDVISVAPGEAELFADLTAARLVIEYPVGQFDGLGAGADMTVNGIEYRVLAAPRETSGGGFMRAVLGVWPGSRW